MMHQFFCFLFLIPGLCNDVAAQQEKQRFIQFGGGWGYYTVLDPAVSPHRYVGDNVLFRIGYLAKKPNVINTLDIDFSYGKLKSGSGNILSSTSGLIGGDINFRKVLRLRRAANGKFTAYVGAGLLTHGLYRSYELFMNNGSRFDYTNSISAESIILKNFSFKNRKLTFGWRLSLTAFSASIVPAYNTSLPEGFIHHGEKPVSATLKSVDFVTMNAFQRIITGFTLNYPLLNGNSLQLDYNWDFYHYSKMNKLTVASHSFRLLLLFSLSKPS